MEILSTGEKIKRARIFKGITLKELCKDKISIAKMSCIENGKTKPDKELIEYIAEKIEADVNYLLEDVYEQIQKNLQKIKENIDCDSEIEEKIENNLEYSVRYGYYNLAFQLIHILFDYYINNNQQDKINAIVHKYYNLYQKNNDDNNTVIYLKDMAEYFLKNKEYVEAMSYYSKLHELISDNKYKNSSREEYCLINYVEALCLEKMGRLEEAFEILKNVMEVTHEINDNEVKGKIYQLYTALAIFFQDQNADLFKDKAFECQKDDEISLALACIDYGKYYFIMKEEGQALQEINRGISLYPDSDVENKVKFLNQSINILMENNQYDLALKTATSSLDKSIITNNIRLIEESYYINGHILQKMKRFKEAEKFMNLSLDALYKFGSREQRKERYLKMANLYFELGEISDSLKYFNLALRVEKKIDDL